MIKENWDISLTEKKRILELHESATKKLYLIKEQTEESTEFSIPKNVDFNFSLKFLNIRSDLKARTDDKGDVYVFWGEEPRKLPTVQEVGLPKFIPTEEGLLKAVGDEWEWLNSFNEYIVRNTLQDPTFFIPSYGKSTSQLHFLRYEFLEITKREKRSLTESKDYLQSGDGKYMNFGDVSLIVQGDDLPTSDRIRPISPPSPRPVTPPSDEPKEVSLKLDISNPFLYDKTILTPEGQNAFNKFVEDLKKNLDLYSGDVEVITSASIDADPKKTADYNMRLSERRANAIIDELKRRLGQTKLNFIPKPLGQTEQFAPGLKYPKVSARETAPNRRLIINLPKVTVRK